jgi:hypothetical protein
MIPVPMGVRSACNLYEVSHRFLLKGMNRCRI